MDIRSQVAIATDAVGVLVLVSTSVVRLRIQEAYEINKDKFEKLRTKRSLLHTKLKPSDCDDEVDVIIIGSGMAGLSCATILC